MACFAPVKEEEVCTHVRALHVCARLCVRVCVCVCNTHTCACVCVCVIHVRVGRVDHQSHGCPSVTRQE